MVDDRSKFKLFLLYKASYESAKINRQCLRSQLTFNYLKLFFLAIDFTKSSSLIFFRLTVKIAKLMVTKTTPHLFQFWELIIIISETMQDRDIVAIEEDYRHST